MDARGLAAGWTKAKKTESEKHTGRPQRLTTGGWEGKLKAGRDPELHYTIHNLTQSPRKYKQGREREKEMKKF